MDLQKIYTDSDFQNAVVPAGQILVFNGTENGTPVTRYKDSSGSFGTIAGGGGGGDAAYYKCAAVDTAAKTWTGYKAVLTAGVYTFEETVTEGLTYGSAFTPAIGKVYNHDASIVTTLWKGEIYIRFQIDAQRSSSEMQFSEIVLFDANGSECMLGDFLSGDISYNENNASPSTTETPEKVLDGDINSKWLDQSGDSPKFIQGKFQIKISDYTHYGWYTANDGEHKDPVSWQLMTSSDGNTWTAVSTVTDHDVTTDRNALAGRWAIQ